MLIARATVTDDDLRTLVKGATPDDRALAAHKLCRAVDREDLSTAERERAHEILRLMAKDATDLVRRALAITLKSSPVLPNDVAMRLARDPDNIAVPVLNFSPAFSDADLIEIARTGGPVRQVAIAKRPVLHARVAEVLIEVGCEEAVTLVCANDNIALGPSALLIAMERFEHAEPVLGAIVHRRTLPLEVTEKLVHLVSETLKRRLIDHHKLSPQLARQITVDTSERATVDLADQAGTTQNMGAFVAHLHRSGRLTASLLLRGLAQGHVAFFEWGVAELAGVPHACTWLMIHDAGPLGLKAIYERAGLPSRQFPAFRAALDTYRSMAIHGAEHDLGRFQERILQRFLTSPQTAAQEDIDYLMDKLDRLVSSRRAREPRSSQTVVALDA
jgi:uncharacterized protein (DUF2336 family)